MDLRKTGWEFLDLINLSQDRDQCWELVNMLIYFQVP
jgi:hypothetical protein